MSQKVGGSVSLKLLKILLVVALIAGIILCTAIQLCRKGVQPDTALRAGVILAFYVTMIGSTVIDL